MCGTSNTHKTLTPLCVTPSHAATRAFRSETAYGAWAKKISLKPIFQNARISEKRKFFKIQIFFSGISKKWLQGHYLSRWLKIMYRTCWISVLSRIMAHYYVQNLQDQCPLSNNGSLLCTELAGSVSSLE